jgi:nitroreductase
MELDKAIKQRHCVRKFSKKKPDWRMIVEAIDSAHLAPLAGNVETLKFLITGEQDTIDKVAKAAGQDFISQAKFVVVVCSKEERAVTGYGERARVYARQQAGAAIENFLLKIEELGLAACWVGAFHEPDVKRIFRIPDDIVVEAILPIGFADEKSKQKPKPELSSMVYWDRWMNKYMYREKKQEV